VSEYASSSLRAKDCRSIARADKLSNAIVDEALAGLPGWTRVGSELRKTFTFPDYYRTIAFVNAMAWIANQQDHHPDLAVHYNRCVVAFSTHDSGGITLKDLVCAARVDALET
jgi:4a-hydroxytetrahydrobiopterin dehydratase